jgi:hypothetical protein
MRASSHMAPRHVSLTSLSDSGTGSRNTTTLCGPGRPPATGETAPEAVSITCRHAPCGPPATSPGSPHAPLPGGPIDSMDGPYTVGGHCARGGEVSMLVLHSAPPSDSNVFLRSAPPAIFPACAAACSPAHRSLLLESAGKVPGRRFGLERLGSAREPS